MIEYPDFGEEVNDEVNFSNKIYDMEININSILGFLRGWEIKYSKKEKKEMISLKEIKQKYFQ